MSKMWLSRFLFFIGIMALLFFVLFPFIQMLSTSLKAPDAQFTIPPQWIPNQITFENFAAALHYKEFVRYFMNSLLISIITCVLVIIISVLAAYSFTRLEFPGRRFFLNVILVSQMFCLSAIVVPLYKLVGSLGLLNSFAGLILAYMAFTVPVAVWLLRSFLLNIPMDMEEAAMMEGASKLKAFFKVVVPLLRPGIGATAAYVFLITWQEFLFSLVFMSKPENRTLPVGIMDFKGQYETNWGTMMAASILISIPVFILFMFIQKQLIAGLTEGATKG
ncbi:carbohydrate ABC transporter permease [Paenibacillus alginolyticus]|uniref:Carbohydrate ABC transporter permease n=1 Tax=Paenibacillus alginolyticus TaxID=59839 RepID=A0ABT4GGH4_9BACL|nr:carbohydrate ABC transporter permease [Paenibacillus alginolyticus]MCY9668382.1 carbohydrate ABC transporter permease [Paenibacillus alginolyticus]MCY9695292.1 carbohydrate ABC transporter permease [Paenibacillus alginolyticus]MEC0144816.1 carbohydrate ABC transporter permease [Paenibacillus alginolyticus]